MRRLFLASEAKHPDTINDLDKFVGGIRGKRIAYIPTAANGEEAFGSWKETPGRTWEIVNQLGARITLVQLEDYKNSAAVKLLENQDIIWFAGGAASYLMYWILRCRIDKHLPALLDKGAIYVGSSAGAMVTSKTLDNLEWYPGEPEPGAHFLPGLGLVDFDFFPHYEDRLYETIKKNYRGNKLYLVKNGEALIVEDEKITVLGETRVIL